MESRISLEALANVNYIDPAKARFYIENDNFLSLDYDGVKYKNVKLHRAMPFKLPDDYISVQDMESKELFLIRSLSQHLKKRYFCPKITAIPSIKAKLGFLYFEVDTDAGHKSFALRDATHNIRRIDDGARIIIVDVDGNRYEISDVSKMPSADFKRIEPYLL
jgi:hypothetical protein